jgi:hypothetical protein
VSNENLTFARNGNPDDTALADRTVRGNIELLQLAHRLDPTRPVVEASNCWPEDPVLSHTALSAINVYVPMDAGPLRAGIPARIAAVKRRIAALTERHPNKPILATEFGSWAIRGLHADHFPGEPYQAELIRRFWEELVKIPGMIGAFIFCFADYDVHRRFEWLDELRVAYGLFDRERRPKAAAEVVHQLWTGSS